MAAEGYFQIVSEGWNSASGNWVAMSFPISPSRTFELEECWSSFVLVMTLARGQCEKGVDVS